MLYSRMDQLAPALNPLHTTIRHSEEERLFTMLGSYTHLLAQCAAIILLFTGFAGLLEIGLEGHLSFPRICLLLLASLLMVSLAFLSALPLDNVLGRLLHHASMGPAVPLHLFGILIGAFGSCPSCGSPSGATERFSPTNDCNTSLPDVRIPPLWEDSSWFIL